jgi:hypothetical protein
MAQLKIRPKGFQTGWDCRFNGVTPETEETPDD